MALGPQLLMLPSPDFNGSGDLYPLNMPAWTLLFEFWANIIYVLIWRWLKSTRMLIGVVILSAVVLAACAISYGTLDQGPSWGNFWGGFARAMFGFFAGVLVFRLVGSPKAPSQRRSWTAIPALFAVPLLCIIPQTQELRPYIELTIVCLVGPWLLVWGQAIQPWKPLAKLFGKAGAISYACYVLHYPLFELMKRLNWRFPVLSHEWTPWTGVAVLLVALAISWWAEKYYDRPARALLNGAIKKLVPGKRRKTPNLVAAE
jgi:peptidoglycan/LPS O-acetylase OafA/YrhL